MSDKAKKMGILGCAAISRVSIVKPLKSVGSIQLYAIAGKSYEKAQEYAVTFGIPKVFGNYSELLKCEEIDLVYIPLSNDLHAEWAVNAAKAKKHILLESPACLSPEDFLKLMEACRENGVKVLEAIMVQHHPWQSYLVNIVDTQAYGRLQTIRTHVSFIPGHDFLYNYSTSPELGGGVFYSLSPYWLQFLQCFDDITSAEYEGYSGFSGPNGSDWTFLSSMTFQSGIRSEFIGSYELPYRATHELIFENGAVRIKDFFRANWGKYKVDLEVEDYQIEKKEIISFEPQNYYVNQLQFLAEVLDGKRENIDPNRTYERILAMSRIYNRARLESRKWKVL